MATTIQVSDYVKDELDRLKEDCEHTSYDSVLRQILREADE
jgi:predicted transcriptional regulator